MIAITLPYMYIGTGNVIAVIWPEAATNHIYAAGRRPTEGKTMVNQIADEAIKARTHLIEALKGLDEIIRLANEAGRDDVKQAAEAAKRPIEKAAAAFNDQVTDSGGDARKIDPIEINKANEAADNADKAREELLEELKQRVDNHDRQLGRIDQNNQDWGFGPDRNEAGKPKPVQGSWADFVTEQTLSYAKTLHGENGVAGLTGQVSDLYNRTKALEWNLEGLQDDVEKIQKSKGNSFPFNARMAGIIGVAVLVIAYVVFGPIISGSFTAALFWACSLSLTTAVIGGLLTAKKK